VVRCEIDGAINNRGEDQLLAIKVSVWVRGMCDVAGVCVRASWRVIC
jgi:hypothetical protein